ncbi:MAG: class I SAM-dependent methyltransferase [Rhodocyclales bacterium]|nr:class I SAM-dependent methyltransferase [Rhodocyclales bacterium]
MTLPSGGAFYKEYPKSCDPEDYWGQVGRTVNGKPVPQEQIDLIVAAVCQGLDLGQNDSLLDLCCGNGALTTYFFSRCRGGLGVDFSDCLIDVANSRFKRRESESYRCQDVLEFVRQEENPQRFSKALCYGSFQYLSPPASLEVLALLRHRFKDVGLLFIGNLPDKDRLSRFYADKPYVPGIENQADSPIGIWRTTGEICELAAAAGWKCSISRMQDRFYGSGYRYDALLVPA